MSDPYREGVPPSGLLDCPRCGKPLPPMDVATCPDECGTWVNATIASIAFDAEEIRENRITRWWRVREPCPVCKEQMILRGSEDEELFQGCTKHGYWIDVDTVSKTGLGRPGLNARLRKIREDEEAQKFARAKLKADAEAAAIKAAHEQEERKRESERLRQERERDAEKAREEARKEAERKQEARQREATERRRAKENAKREKADAERRAKEREQQLLDERRARLLATVKDALAANDPGPIVHELLRQETQLAELTKRVLDLERHTVKFERDDDD